jgi:phage repressor protein C with HTH and peptisase S24 domain
MATPMKSEEGRLPDDVLRRLRKAGQAYGSYEKIAKDAEMPISTVQKLMRGAVDPRFSTMSRLCRTLGVTLDYLNFGIGADSGDQETFLGDAGEPDLASVPVYDIRVSAGDGREAWDERPIGVLAFRIDWLKRRFSDLSALAIFRVDGDSMEPELRHDDLLMIDQAQREPRDGLYVVRLGEQLLAKRLQVAGRNRLKLTSANPAYAPIEVDAASNESFDVIGRAVWVGRNI